MYYQLQPGVHNHYQQYDNYRIIQQASYRNDYDRDKGVSYGVIRSGIPTFEKQEIPVIPLKKYYNYRKKAPTYSSSTFLKKTKPACWKN